MDTAWILVRQILQMFLLAGTGFLLFRTKKITSAGSKALGNILIYTALPATIINGFLVERTQEHLLGIPAFIPPDKQHAEGRDDDEGYQNDAHCDQREFCSQRTHDSITFRTD